MPGKRSIVVKKQTVDTYSEFQRIQSLGKIVHKETQLIVMNFDFQIYKTSPP